MIYRLQNGRSIFPLDRIDLPGKLSLAPKSTVKAWLDLPIRVLIYSEVKFCYLHVASTSSVATNMEIARGAEQDLLREAYKECSGII